MAVGLPIPRRVSRIIKSNDFLLRIALTIYNPYMKFYIKFWTWFHYNRKNSAPLAPFKLLWINPDQIKYSLTSEGSNYSRDYIKPRVRAGDWDKKAVVFEDKEVFKSLKMRFEENKRWEDTPKFQSSLESIKGEKDRYHYKASNEEELRESFDRIDELYNQIQENGYKTQREVNSGSSVHSSVIDEMLPSVNEIIVSIGRGGQILLEDGNHRLSIAKILGLDLIPVRVLVRHKKWQEKRNKAVENPKSLENKVKDHCDISYLL